MSSYNPVLVYDYDDIMRIAEGDHQIWAAAHHRCIDVGGCPECFCVAEEQGREHWSHCSKACKALVRYDPDFHQFVDLLIAECEQWISRKRAA